MAGLAKGKRKNRCSAHRNQGGRMSDLAAVFAALHKILALRAAKLAVVRDDDPELCVGARLLRALKGVLFFGAVQVKKACVSFHLLPLSLKPELLASAWPELPARMQGKSCFSFEAAAPALFPALSAFTKAGFGRCKEPVFV